MVLKELILTVSTLGRYGSLERTDFNSFYFAEGVAVLKKLNLTVSTLQGCVVLKVLDLTVSTLESVVVLKELILTVSTLRRCGSLERTGF